MGQATNEVGDASGQPCGTDVEEEIAEGLHGASRAARDSSTAFKRLSCWSHQFSAFIQSGGSSDFVAQSRSAFAAFATAISFSRSFTKSMIVQAISSGEAR